HRAGSRESYREGSQTVDPVETARGAAERTSARTPVSNTERRQRVIDEIKRRIVLGELRPGERIIEADLTSSLEVSRPTAREALNQMARDGFLIQEATAACGWPISKSTRCSRSLASALLSTPRRSTRSSMIPPARAWPDSKRAGSASRARAMRPIRSPSTRLISGSRSEERRVGKERR